MNREERKKERQTGKKAGNPGKNGIPQRKGKNKEEMSEIPASEGERERERASDRASSGVVVGEEEEGRNNFAADRFASRDCEKIFKTVLRRNIKTYC